MAITDKRLASFSIFFIVFVFILQAILVYNLYSSKINALQGEINMIIDKSYSKDLGIRMGYLKGNFDKIDMLENSESKDLSSAIDLDDKIFSEGYVPIATIRAEQRIATDKPLDVNRIDSIVSLILHDYNFNLNFSVKLIDSHTQNVLQSSNAEFNNNRVSLTSKDVPLDYQYSKIIRLVAYPEAQFYLNMGWILLLSLVLSFACIYCFFLQLRTISRQRVLSRMKNDFFADVSHELKQPLTVLRQALDSFRNETILSNPIKREHLFYIVDSEITKLDDKLKMVISLTMQNEGMFELHFTDFDLPKMVFDLADEILVLPTKQIDLNVENKLINDPIVYADKNHIEQVISNLLGNAIKYSGNQVDLNIKLYRSEKNKVFISVQDNGIGISKSDQKIIFEKYSRVDTNSVAKGTGIGLNYIKRIVTKHSGGVILNSELGKGSEFIVWLPQPKKQ